MTYAKIYKLLKAKILSKDGYGPRCKEFAWSCPTCGAWLMLDILQDMVDTEKFGAEMEKIL